MKQAGGVIMGLVLGITFWREAPETAVEADRRAGKWGCGKCDQFLVRRIDSQTDATANTTRKARGMPGGRFIEEF